ncbi:MAG: hypothetical protein K5866_09295 [Treponema sp.]|nr:hypothetical protein [Treponema sp.]
MKRFNIVIFSVITATAFLACSLEIPKKVSVKTDAEYNFSIGDVENDSLSENFKPSELFASVEGAEVLDYCPDGDETLQQFLLQMPITSIPIDFSSYFDSLDLSGQISNMSFSQSMTVPSSLTQPHSQALDLDSINDAINAGVTILGSVTTSDAAISYAIDNGQSGTDFTSIEYESGYMTISQAPSYTITDGTTVTLTFADSSTVEGTFSNGSTSLDMSGKTVTKTGMKIKFSACQGAVYAGAMSSDSQIKEAVGVTVDSGAVNITVDAFTIEQGSSLGYKSCTVGEGDLNVSLTTPDSWSGLTVEYQIATSGGLEITDDTLGSSNNAKTISLDGKTLLPEDITVTPTIKASLSNATINFEEEMTVSMQAAITTISSLTAEISSEGFTPTISSSNELPSGMMNYIYSILFAKCGLKGKYTNSLPDGNTVTFTTNCDFFGLSNKVSTLAGGKTDEELTITSTNREIVLGSEAGQYDSIDFSATIALPGADSSNPNQFTITNVEVGETYTIAVELEPVLDWSEMKIKTENAAPAQSQQISTGMNIVSLFSSFESTLGDNSFSGKFKIDSLPVYLYIVKPELSLLDELCFDGSLKAYYATQAEDGTITQVTAAGGEVTLANSEGNGFEFVDSMPDYAKNSDGVVIKDISNYDCSAKADFAPLSYDVNATDDSFVFVDYDLQLASSSGDDYITITKDALENSTSSSSEIAINAVIALPLKVTTTDDISFDLLALTNNNGGDIFGRTSAPDLGEMQEWLEAIEEVKLSYAITDKPFYSDPSMKLYINLNDGGNTYNLSEDTLVLSDDAVESLLQYPCRPEVKINIDSGTVFKIPRTMKIGAHINLSLKTNGDKAITVYEAGGN